jgi:hypothetical protein
MKTSNKILLAIFLTIIILTTVIQVMVYAKYKRGEFVKFNRDAIIEMTSVEVPAIRFISLKGLGSCAVKPGEKYKLDIQKEKVSRVTYQVVNDTLVIIGDPSLTIDQLERGDRNRNPVVIYLPSVVPIKGAFSTIRLYGSNDSAKAPSYNIQLGKLSHLFTSRGGSGEVYFNELTFNGERSNVELDHNSIITSINMQLVKTRFDDQEAVIKNMTITADEGSNIHLSGKNINALK